MLIMLPPRMKRLHGPCLSFPIVKFPSQDLRQAADGGEPCLRQELRHAEVLDHCFTDDHPRLE